MVRGGEVIKCSRGNESEISLLFEMVFETFIFVDSGLVKRVAVDVLQVILFNSFIVNIEIRWKSIRDVLKWYQVRYRSFASNMTRNSRTEFKKM